MLLSNHNIEFPGMGVALFSVAIFLTLLLWKAYYKSASGLAKTINAFLIAGVVYGIFSWGFALTDGLDPGFYTNIGAKYDLMLVDLAALLLVLFDLLYIRRRTSKDGTAKDILCIVTYLLVGVLALIYIANAVITPGGNHIYNVLTPEGIVYNPKVYSIVNLLLIVIKAIPFIFVLQGWKRALPKERVILALFAAIPWICSVITYLVYRGKEMDVSFAGYAILGILMVFFDQVQLDYNHEKQRAFAEKLARDAMRDKVTGLTNGDIFSQQVDQNLRENGSQGSALAIISIDKYQEYIGIYGRQFCEDLLKEAGRLLKEVLRADDMAGRIGTDEFGVFFRCEVRYFDGLVCKMRDKLDFEHEGVAVSATVGAARVTDNDSDYDYLMALADRTHRMAAREGLGTYKLVSR